MNRTEFSHLIKQRCSELGVKVVAPYALIDTQGNLYEFAAHLPDFGSPDGMLIDILSKEIDNKAQREFALEHGHWLSIVNPDPWSESIENVSEALKDWSFFGERCNRADFAAFDRIMARPGGEPPKGDDIP